MTVILAFIFIIPFCSSNFAAADLVPYIPEEKAGMLVLRSIIILLSCIYDH